MASSTSCALIASANAVEQRHGELEPAQRVREIVGDWKRASLGDEIDVRRSRKQLNGLLEALRTHVLFQVRQMADGIDDEVVQHCLRSRKQRRRATHDGDALAVRRAALDEPIPEDALHVRVTGETEGLRESHHCRGLHGSPCGGGSNGVERDMLRMFQREPGDSLQLRR